jgi:lipoprotein-anchoring transpeptidase ErfK/SrfK
MAPKLTRREMLKWMVAASAAAVAPHVGTRAESARIPIAPEPQTPDAWELHGRVIQAVAIYEEPSTASARQATYARDQSFPITGETRAPFSAHNDLWYETPEGYVHSAWVLPVRVYPKQPLIEDLPAFGMWGEIAQVYTIGYAAPSPGAGRVYRFYGGTMFRVLESRRDEAGVGWYKVKDDYPPRQTTNHQWVLAEDVRRVSRAEMAPIRPFVGEKRIEVDLEAQRLTAYEGEEAVFTTLVASGVGGTTATAPGSYCVLLKQPSRHMSNVPYEDMRPEDQPAPGSIFDLPGVPWCIFIDLKGTAIHGAYWHNDYGIRRSSGCVNVPIDAARWLYRWTHPVGGYEDDFVQSTCRVGTPVIVF